LKKLFLNYMVINN